jgi:hypothetical protein
MMEELEETRGEDLSDGNKSAKDPTVVSEKNVDGDIGSDGQWEKEDEEEEWDGIIFEKDYGKDLFEELTDVDVDDEVDVGNVGEMGNVDVDEGRMWGENVDIDVDEDGRGGEGVEANVEGVGIDVGDCGRGGESVEVDVDECGRGGEVVKVDVGHKRVDVAVDEGERGIEGVDVDAGDKQEKKGTMVTDEESFYLQLMEDSD